MIIVSKKEKKSWADLVDDYKSKIAEFLQESMLCGEQLQQVAGAIELGIGLQEQLEEHQKEFLLINKNIKPAWRASELRDKLMPHPGTLQQRIIAMIVLDISEKFCSWNDLSIESKDYFINTWQEIVQQEVDKYNRDNPKAAI